VTPPKSPKKSWIPHARCRALFLFGIAIATGLYLLLNAAFLHVLPFNRLATSVLVAGDVASTIFGAHGNLAITVLALLVVLASPQRQHLRHAAGDLRLAREGLGPRVLAEVTRAGRRRSDVICGNRIDGARPRRARSCSSWPWRSGSC